MWRIGNEKLGKGVYHTSRAVGTTCPSSCKYLNNGCYAERLEKRFPNVKTSWEKNTDGDPDELAEGFKEAAIKDRLIRLHIGGDFGFNNRIDQAYVMLVLLGLRENLCNVLAFTHFITKEVLPKALNAWMHLFASVHNEEEIDTAWKTGYRKLALCVEETKTEWKGGAWMERYGKRFLVCPEQRGKLPNCEACGYCWKDKGHVTFLRH